ncbi:hypothetical protein HGP14_32975 [Rhizobium sp. P32RR-XVIII]|uniref:hypothetical protein n=1 Tax=Rhizobium sp. P32RR-XVIII TaxID=2726738 RepID=UPI001457838A|nr:hypothetical protein [Rhizobium sp. P32RR-XVIII]NLS08022.1 hypothetical protein [Rhizobium sp. P32RR-XVIII]
MREPVVLSAIMKFWCIFKPFAFEGRRPSFGPASRLAASGCERISSMGKATNQKGAAEIPCGYLIDV